MKMTMKMKMKVEAARVSLVLAAVWFLLWSSSSVSAASMQCHFDSRGLCEFEGRRFSLGESWMDDSCMQCTCLYPVGVGCCETVQRPVDFPAWCQVRVERVSCTVSLVQTADPRLPCLPGEELKDPSHGSVHLQLQLQDYERD
ncbi:prostate-associated microseminoprotein [Cynoglossus semilaevis]|uniref:prostate-associated microseminoprotein n=1 Tax=Cynoglossus semilaevis TaxID=244447 RepID=UPI0007DCB02E|nr:prostate-associated microseminoprotein [Cynoglossus semilaevis]